MVILEAIQLRRGPQLLLEDASATLQPGQKLALIGANGSGKSSLMALLLGDLAPDRGEIRGLGNLRVAHMAQEIAGSEVAARDFVLSGDQAVYRLLCAVADAESRGEFAAAAKHHQALEGLDGYSATRRAEGLLRGLGFSDAAFNLPVSDFSGGWRVRLNLARALMTPSDLLLLDEPTNHLDMDTLLWLQRWLQRYPGTLLLISHDRDFIDQVCDRTLSIEQRRLIAYRGGYSAFEQQRAERMAQQDALHARQQREIAHIEAFVRRFKAKATKARQAQSRLKALERLERVAPAHVDSPFSFRFPEPGKTSDPLLVLSEATLGYGKQTVLSGINCSLHPGDRIGLLGRNGAGKSTLLKGLVGSLPLMAGSRVGGAHLRIGYFDQQQVDVLDAEASPLLHLQRLTPGVREQGLLDFLGGFDFQGDRATAAIDAFSGGEKARLALAMVVWQDPNLLILDEPTNHLDLEMRHALAMALQDFSGAIVLVSHDRHLIRHAAESLWLVDGGRVAEFAGDLETYEQWLLAGDNPPAASADVAPQGANAAGDTSPTPRGKQQRQAAAEQRRQLRPLQAALAKTESSLDQAQSALATLQERLTDNDLYLPENAEPLKALLVQEGELKIQVATLEESWINQQEALEAAGG